MSIFVATAKEARRNTERNACSRWYRKDADPDQTNGALAFQRVRKGLFRPEIRPGFKLRREDKLFAIGSCFARAIERALVGRKMDVLSAAPEFKSFPVASSDVTGVGFTNKYNTYSILNELRWALDPSARFPRESMVELGNGFAYDPHTNPTLTLADLSETLRRRSLIEMVMRRVAQCRVVIVTLGLVEVWRDKVADIFINTTPITDAFRTYPERYEAQISNFSQNFATLEQLYSLLRQFGHPDFNIVVTVSPVPLMATFANQDVVIANTYSKSTLRSVAEEWAAGHSNIHYFPSYEIVMNSEPAITWEEDLRHVRGRVVQYITGLFLDHYLE